MNIPTQAEAERLLNEAEAKNPGGWADHARYVALAARNIAEVHPDLDPETAYILGLLHDIGRREGVTKMRHGLDGYRFLQGLGYDAAARICITHSFVIKDMALHEGRWDCSRKEFETIEHFLEKTEFTLYDRLLQLCDALAIPSGICLMEKRLVDTALRGGVNRLTVPKWKALFKVKSEIETIIGTSIYKVMPGITETTFGFAP